MKLYLCACLMLMWTLTAPVSCQEQVTGPELKVIEIPDGIKLSCGNGYTVSPQRGETVGELKYLDENTGEYHCENADGQPEGPKIFVKFRTCDNCIEMDEKAIAGIVMGNVVATIVIGVSVYLIASQTRVGPTTSKNKKSSDRQHLVHNEMSNRNPNDDYQPLQMRQKDTYDVLQRK